MASRPLVSAALIVRDEQEKLGRCLDSIAPWCDEVVVVDTGSVDDTVAIAHQAGATVLHRPWDDDFAAARNHGLGHASGEWILYIDADEVVDPLARNVAHAELRGNEALALRVWFHDRPDFTPYREFRLWRNRPDVRFVGRMHETPVPDLRRIAADEGLGIVDSDVIRMRHDGYEGDQTAKHLRNLPLLEARLQELPERVYLWNHLGQVRAALGDADGALAAWQAGVQVVRSRGLADRTDVLAYGGLGKALIDRGEDITALLDELDAIAPWYRTATLLRAENHRAQGRHRAAVEVLQRLLLLADEPPDPTLSYSTAMFTDWAWEALADCFVQLGEPGRAAEVLAAAHRERPDRVDYRTRSVGLAAVARQQQARADQR